MFDLDHKDIVRMLGGDVLIVSAPISEEIGHIRLCNEVVVDFIVACHFDKICSGVMQSAGKLSRLGIKIDIDSIALCVGHDC